MLFMPRRPLHRLFAMMVQLRHCQLRVQLSASDLAKPIHPQHLSLSWRKLKRAVLLRGIWPGQLKGLGKCWGKCKLYGFMQGAGQGSCSSLGLHSESHDVAVERIIWGASII